MAENNSVAVVGSHAPGAAATVGNLAAATGGIEAGNFVEPDIDDQLFQFQSEDTALMGLMLKARRVKVQSPVVDHYMIDEQRSTVMTTEAQAESSGTQFAIKLGAADKALVREHHTLLCVGVTGYDESGKTPTAGHDLMLYVVGREASTDNPVVKPINGPRIVAGFPCSIPAIPAETKVRILANAMYETQKEVDPDLVVPQPSTVYLQKRGMNQVVSDYFDAQRKRIPFTQSMIAEQAILNFKRAGNRTLWAGQKGKMHLTLPKMGEQTVYFTEGLRWQFRRELLHTGRWSINKLLALAKIFFTSEDAPRSGTLLAGKNLLEDLQYADFTSHPEIQVLATHNTLGWAVTRVHTVFGDIDIKREPTLDALGWCNSGALIATDRLVHYTYSTRHEFADRIEGEEATRRGMVVWDGLAMKGTCHIWINGGDSQPLADAFVFGIWDQPTAPKAGEVKADLPYYMAGACPGIGIDARTGTYWTTDGDEWKPADLQ